MDANFLKTKSIKELHKIIMDLKAELFTLRFKNTTGQLEQPHKINMVKKDIARALTVYNIKIENHKLNNLKQKKETNLEGNSK
ncbi:MAG: 50S ribosomal protein L29 [Mycoplasma sp.]|nr:50S ribosomal protein L29 [Mycoplasma sp.]